jgi:Beta-ketoacyl synthase, N-terminal domain
MSGHLRVGIEGIALLAPGLPDWVTSQPILTGAQPYSSTPLVLPQPPELSPAERRRAIPSVKLAFTVAAAAVRMAGRTPQNLATVFASSGVDGETIESILTALTTPNREVSPTRFGNSVHNATAGSWGLSMQCQEASTSVCAHDASFTAGLLEAATQVAATSRPILFVAYDLPYSGALHAVRPLTGPFGAAFMLSPDPTKYALRIDFTATEGNETGCADAELETLRSGNPAARSLPLLIGLARGRPDRVRLNLARGGLLVDIEPC